MVGEGVLVASRLSIPRKIPRLVSQFLTAGADAAPVGLLIDALASVKKESDDEPNLANTDVVARTAFRKSPLYESFVEHRTHQLIKNARDAKGEERLELLRSAKLLPGLTDSVRETLDITITLFDDQTMILQRVQFLAGSERATTIAIDWDPRASSVSLHLGSP